MGEFEGFDAQLGLTVMQAATRQALVEIGRLCESDLPRLTDVISSCVVSVRSSSGQVRSTFRVAPRAWQLAGEDDAVYGEISLSGDEFLGAADYVTRLVLGVADIYDTYFNIPSRSNKRRYRNKRGAETLRRLGLEVEYGGERRGYVPTGIAMSHLAEYSRIAAELEEFLILRTPTEVAVGELMAELAAAEVLAAGADGSEAVSAKKSRYVFATCGCIDAHGKARTIRVAAGSWGPNSIHCSICFQSFANSAESPGTNDSKTSTSTDNH